MNTLTFFAENNWCGAKGSAGKCCMSCKVAEETKDPDCYDKAECCVYYKPDHYKDQAGKHAESARHLCF